MADFCTVADVAAFLQVEISDAAKVASCERAITEASESIRNYCRQQIDLVAGDQVALDVATSRCTKLFLPELPVVSVAAVVEDGETLVEGADEDYQLGSYGILYRRNGYWAQGVQVVEVTYTHGYATIPQDVVDVATRAASRAYQAALKAADAGGVPGVASKSLGDYSVSFQAEQGGGVGEGVMGASAARMLLLSEKDILNRYRVKGP
ncbi:MAG TPA: hypothetical protein PLN42_00275 [Anaerolineae bacterium]|nr:hypothetical protein [Anaerolineae bacterium]